MQIIFYKNKKKNVCTNYNQSSCFLRLPIIDCNFNETHKNVKPKKPTISNGNSFINNFFFLSASPLLFIFLFVYRFIVSIDTLMYLRIHTKTKKRKQKQNVLYVLFIDQTRFVCAIHLYIEYIRICKWFAVFSFLFSIDCCGQTLKVYRLYLACIR